MGKSSILARLVAVCAASAVAGGVLAGAPVSAQAPDVASSSIAAPNTAVASPAPVGGDGVTPRGDVVWTCLRIKIAGVTAGGRASVKVTGPKQSKRKKAKKYSKVIDRSTTLQVRPGVYQVTSATVPATGGTDVPKVATKTLRVRNNRCTGFTVRYQFVASTPVPPVPPVITCATGGGAANTCVVGATGPGGGPVFYVLESNTTGSRYMEAAPSGWNSPATTDDPALAWGGNSGGTDCTDLDVAGTSPAIGTGFNNTNLIRTACDTAAKAPAAWAAYNYSNGTANSWYLPSRLELNQECRYASGDTADATATTCSGNVSPVGGFAADDFWSSSQFGAGHAWLQFFVNGGQFAFDKDFTLRVRPVRAF